MRALLLRDAVRSYGAAAALVVVPLLWVWRSFKPWEIRAALASLPVPWSIVAWAGLVLAYVALTGPVARLLLASSRLEYWRQFPVSRAQWLRLHADHLVLINLPGAAVATYLMLPHGVAVMVGGVALASAAAVAGQVLVGRLWPATRVVVRWPRPRTALGALGRIYAIATSRRDRAAVFVSGGAQLLAVLVAALAVRNVGLDPEELGGLWGGAAFVGGLAAGWLVLRAQRAVDRDRWALDGLPAVTPARDLRARWAFGVAAGLPTVIGLAVVATPGPTLAVLLWTVVSVAWAAAVFARIGARAEASRRLADPHHAHALLAVSYGLTLFIALGTWALAAAAAIEGWSAVRASAAAAAVRMRLETTAKDDDHD